MTEAYEDAASRLWWGLRRFAWIFIVVLPITTGVSLLAAQGAPTLDKQYKASALVIATERNFSPELFARLADTVFTGGTVAEKAVEEGHLPLDPQDLIPTYASLEPVQDNIITRVVGLHSDPQLAAAIANSTASALVEELNKSGAGVGKFAVQDQARVPSSPDITTARSVPIAVGLVAGIILGASLIGLIIALRRPLLGSGEAAELVGAPILGTPTLPPLRAGRPVDPQAVKGLSALAKRLLPTLPGVTALVSCGGDERIRTLFAQLVSTVLADRDPAFLIRSEDRSVQAMYEQFSPPRNLVVGDRVPEGQVWRRAAVVIDGPSAGTSDIPQALPIKASIVLVVVEGASLNRVRDASEQFLPGELDGIVFVRRSSRWPWVRSPAAPVQTPHAEVIDQWIEDHQSQRAGTTEVAPEPREIALDQESSEYESGRVISGAEFRND
jgi:capsular polysaccharide biosynthesis protein